MPRWRQVWNEEEGKSDFIPIGEIRENSGGSHAVHGPIEPFVSPIDGSVISDRKQYRDHCKKHNVVPAAEFSDEFYARKKAERERHYTGNPTKEESLSRKKEMYELINTMERQHGR